MTASSFSPSGTGDEPRGEVPLVAGHRSKRRSGLGRGRRPVVEDEDPGVDAHPAGRVDGALFLGTPERLVASRLAGLRPGTDPCMPGALRPGPLSIGAPPRAPRAAGEGRCYLRRMPVELGSNPAIVLAIAIRPLLERIRVVYDPRQLWLFGSRARGDAREDSDWDLLAVVDDATPDRLFDPDVMWRLLDLERYPADVVLLPRSEFLEDADTPNTLAYPVKREGCLLYER